MNDLKLSQQSGVVWILWAFILFLVFTIAAFAVDIGYIFVIKNRAQNAVDAAAQAGADTIYHDTSFNYATFPNSLGATGSPTLYPCDTTGLNPYKNCQSGSTLPGTLTYFTMAQQEVLRLLKINGFTDPPVIEVNTWNTLNSAIVYTNPAVRVTMTSSAPFFFGKLLGQNNQSFTVKALAIAPFPSSVNVNAPLMLADCALSAGWNVTTKTPSSIAPGSSSPLLAVNSATATPNAFYWSSQPSASCISSVFNGTTAKDIAGNTITATSWVANSPSAAFNWPYSSTTARGTTTIIGTTTLPASCPAISYAFKFSAGAAGALGQCSAYNPGAWSYNASPGVTGTTGVNTLVPDCVDSKGASCYVISNVSLAPPGTAYPCPTPSQTGGCLNSNTGAISALYAGASGSSSGTINDCILDKTCLRATMPVVNTGNQGINSGNYPVIGFACVNLLLSDKTNKVIYGKFDSGCSNNSLSNPSASFFGNMTAPLLAE